MLKRKKRVQGKEPSYRYHHLHFAETTWNECFRKFSRPDLHNFESFKKGDTGRWNISLYLFKVIIKYLPVK